MASLLVKLIGISAVAAGSAAVISSIKNKRINVKSTGKNIAKSVKLTVPTDGKYDNGVALTPPMGWSSWNTFRNSIDEDLIVEIAEALKDSGLADAGYIYLNIDDCWQSSLRTGAGRLQGDLVTFPSGIKALVEKVNSLGLKLGLYTSNGTLTCEDLPASLGHEAEDAQTFAEWGVEYFKYDFCHNKPIPTRAPDIEKITVSRGDKVIATLFAKDAELSGNARVATLDKLDTGEFITGLSSNGGSASFNVVVDEPGEYVLTLWMRKKSSFEKYLEVCVNDDEVFSTLVPVTYAFTPNGRNQMKINLNAGMNVLRMYNPVASLADSAARQYTKMGEELKKATAEYARKTGKPEKPIVYSICEWGVNRPWKWGPKAGNMWRTTLDIKPVWASVLGIYEINVRLAKYAGPGGWNDPDMLEVGNGSLSLEENRTHFSLWCMMAAPLILGNDVRKFIGIDGKPDDENELYRIITNRDMIAIDQDKLGVQCRRIKNGVVDVLVKPLEGGEAALCFFNKSSETKDVSLRINEIASKDFVSLPFSDSYEAFDLWSKEKLAIEDEISCTVYPHGVKVYRIKAK
ncbi:MAG: alpha-galactosidase [Clostridiales bacterium]|nr:alpha-galactosidase [Clostridiales bacterium]